MQQLNDKVALVTGFGSGLGRAIAVCFAREGCAVAGTSTTASRGEETLGLIRAEGGHGPVHGRRRETVTTR